LLLVALVPLATSFVVPAAQASPRVDGPLGRNCSYAAISDPSPAAAEDDMTGQMYGGPLVWDRPFDLRCTLQVNANTHASTTYAHRETVSAASGGGQYVAVLPPTAFTYTSGYADADSMCTSVSYAGGRLYWKAGPPGPDRIAGTADDDVGWSTDPNTSCTYVGWDEGPILPPFFEPFSIVDALVVCPALMALHDRGVGNGPAVFVDREGDLFVGGTTEADLFWDCPVYVSDGDAANGVFDP
jgi:hypothetical protein